jgi:hypothetical protein
VLPALPGYEIVHEFTDRISGKKAKRPELGINEHYLTEVIEEERVNTIEWVAFLRG